MITFTANAEETIECGARLGAALHPGDIVVLTGDLGVGKTHFTKGIARALGISDTITSPTFIIMNEYTGGSIPLYHFDMYRLRMEDEIYELGFDDYFAGDGVCVIEWNIVHDFGSPTIHVTIERTGENTRRITIDD